MTSTSPRTRCRVQCVGHPVPRCGVQCVGHPAPRCGGQKSAACGYCLCRYSPPVFPEYRVKARYDVEHRVVARYDEEVRNDRSHIRRKRAASTKQTPPLSGREETSRPRKKGEDCLSTASSAAPEGGDRLRARMPDNSGGTSWFVLLAAEKNEHTGSPRTTMRGPERGLLWVLPLPVFPARVFLDSASSAE